MGWTVLLLVLLDLAAPAARADEVSDGVAGARRRLDKGDVNGCLEALRALRDSHPDDPRPAPLLAFVLFSKKGELREAAEILAGYLEADSPLVTREQADYAVGLIDSIRARALGSGKPDLARWCAKVLMAFRPEEKSYRYDFALASYRLGERGAVERACRSLILDYPSFEPPYYLLARVQVDGERYDEAVRTYRRLIQERPGEAEPRMMLGSLFQWQMRDYAGARDAYRRALEVAGDDPAVVARIRGEIDRLEEMREQARRARARYRKLGWVLVALLAVYGAAFAVVAGRTRVRPIGGP